MHDELIVLAPQEKARATLDEMLAIMATPPVWAAGLPMAAEGYCNTRYVKPPKP